jgi:sortase A
VDSLRESSYEEALSHGFAHFKGTYLPGDEGNVFIYGHSAAGDYADRNPSDVVTAFTRLFKLNIGDKISVSFEGNEYTYIVKKIKEVKPEDTEILHPNTGGKTLTLMTCSPPGLNSRRLIVVASQQ